ncbi:MAG: hypothetical protein WC848_04270 [Parcubacteria group bacterium]|jgi:hypothetical protein
MDRKKIIIPIIALIILFGGALFIAQSLSNKKASLNSDKALVTDNNQSPANSENSGNPTSPDASTIQDGQSVPTNSGDLLVKQEQKPGTKTEMGLLDSVDGKSLTLKLADKLFTVGISDTTPVTVSTNMGKTFAGHLSDLTVGELAKVVYYEDSKKASDITVMKIELPDDTKKLIDLPQP